MKSNIDTLSTAGINFSCLLCLRRQRLQKICTSSTVAFLGYVDYIRLLFYKDNVMTHCDKQVRAMALFFHV